MTEFNILISKIMVAVDMMSRKKKKDKKYPSITKLERTISMKNKHIIVIFIESIVLST